MTDILPREDIVPGQRMSPVWRRFFETLVRNGLIVSSNVTTVQQTVTQLVNAPDANSQPHSDALDQLAAIVGPGFIEKLPGGYLARLLDYPDLPTTDAVGGDTLVLDGTTGLWTPGPASASAAVTISDTPPAAPIDGRLWADSTTGVMYLRYNDGTTSSWVEFGTVGGSGDAVPTAMASGTTFSVAANTQALFSMPIDVGDATLDVSGYLLEVN